MSDRSGAWRSLEFLAEPAFLLRRRGDILSANGAARRVLRPGLADASLFDHVASPHQQLDAYLRRASGSTAPIVGGATLLTVDGEQRFQLHCAALPGLAEDRMLVLRCHSMRDDAFSLLRRRLDDLGRQLRVRLHEKAILQQALRENQALLVELQHRVKNNIQMLHSLIQMSARGAESAETRAVVERARFRLQAMASAQEAIYRAKHLDMVSVGPFLEELVRSIGQAFGAEENLRIEIEEARLSSNLSHCLALIVTELTTNAVKYGLPDRKHGTVRVRFAAVDGGFELSVHDSGPGFLATEPSDGSGLRLVRGLCGQIGASLDIDHRNGTGCVVRFDGGG